MTGSNGHPPSTASEIERRFRSPVVKTVRPAVGGAIGALQLMFRFGWEAEGLEALDGLDPPFIFAANHLSHADTAAILATLPGGLRRRTAVAAALDVFGGSRPDAGRSWSRGCLALLVAAGFHAFPFDRHGPSLRSLRTAVELVRCGWSLLIYPEGTRSRSGRMAAFKPGVGLLAKFTRRPIVPVHVTGGQHILPCGAFLPRPGRVRVRYGPALWNERGESPADFVARLQARVHAQGGARSIRHADDPPAFEVTDHVPSRAHP